MHVDRARADGVAIARRSSGGGTVVVGPGTINATVILPNDFAPGLGAVDTSQTFVLERIAGSLRNAGADVSVKGLGDLTLGNRKVSGSAQRRLRRTFLIHLTILYDFPVERIATYLKPPSRQPDYREGRLHETFLTNLRLGRDAILDALRGAWVPLIPFPAEELPHEQVEELIASRFGDPAWVSRL